MVALRLQTVPAKPLPAQSLLQLCPSPETPRDVWGTHSGLSSPHPTHNQDQTEAEGVAPVAQLRSGRSVGCCEMTKAHMLLTSIC